MLPDWLTPLLAPYAAVPREGAPFPATMETRLRDARCERLQELAFVLLRPETLRSGRAAELLDCLASEHSSFPIGLRVARLGRDLLQALYLPRLPAWGERLWLHEDLFATGPCALILLRGPAGIPGSLSARLDAAKGPTAFLAEAPANLRARFDRPSSIHAVLHVSSDEGALLYEASLFFPWPAIRAALDGAAEIPPDTCRALLACEPHSSASVFEALLGVKIRIYAALELCGSALPPGAASGLRRSAEAQLDSLAGLPPVRQRPIFAHSARDERSVLASLISRAHATTAAAFASTAAPDCRVLDAWSATEALLEPVELLYAAWLLGGNECLDSARLDTLFRRLERSNVPVSDWLRTLIAAACIIDLQSP